MLLILGVEGTARDPMKPGGWQGRQHRSRPGFPARSLRCKEKVSRYHVGKIAALTFVGSESRTDEKQERWDEKRATS
jgi:hypothetical protein